VTNDDGTSGEEPRPLRIGDAERESALQALGEHMKAGRLQVDEYSERSTQVAEARTADQLSALFTDLPEPHPVLPGQAVARAEEGAVEPRRPGGTPMQRAAGGLIGLSWMGAIALVVAAGVGWWVIFVPIALSVLCGSVWGKGWQRDVHERQDRRERRDHHRGRY